MTTPRFVLAALAATFFSTAGLSTAALAAAPTADQVAVPQGASMHHNKVKAMFETPQEFAMFRMDMHNATRGMDHDQKKAYRKSQMQKVRSMTTAERTGWLHGLQAKWDALPSDRKAQLERRMERFAQRQENHPRHQHGDRNQGGEQGNGDQGYGDDGNGGQMTPPPPPPHGQSH